MEDKIRKLKAIKKLAEVGASGEKEAAQNRLEALCKKWNISVASLEGKKEEPKTSRSDEYSSYQARAASRGTQQAASYTYSGQRQSPFQDAGHFYYTTTNTREQSESARRSQEEFTARYEAERQRSKEFTDKLNEQFKSDEAVTRTISRIVSFLFWAGLAYWVLH